MKIPDAQAAVDQEWGKARKIASMASDESQEQKKRVIEEALKEGRTDHFSTLLDLCHLKNSELELKFQKYKGRVVLGSGIEKVDSDSYAAFTKQGPSASQMTAAQVIGVTVRPHTADAVSACTQVRVSRHLDTSTTTQNCPKHGPTSEEPVVSS